MMMVDVRELGRAAIEYLAANPLQREFEIETASLTNGEVKLLIDAAFDEATAASVVLKGVVVDPMQITLPSDSDFVNAFWRRGRLIVADINVDDKIILKRAKRAPMATT